MQDPKQQQWLLEPGGIATRLRELQGKTPGVTFAERAQMRTSKVSKLRLGQQLPTEDDIRAWVAAAGAAPSVADELIAMLAEAPYNHSSFERRLKHGQAKRQQDYNELVEQADVVRMFERSFIPRLLQTFDYAKAILLRSKKRHKTADDVDAAAATRLECQRFLYDGAHRFEFIIDEVVLTRPRASAAIMHDQMDRLLSAIDLASVRLGIIPISAEPENELINSFEMYGQIAIVETYYNDDTQSSEAWEKYNETMSNLWVDAVEGDAARAIVTDAKARYAAKLRDTDTGEGNDAPRHD